MVGIVAFGWSNSLFDSSVFVYKFQGSSELLRVKDGNSIKLIQFWTRGRKIGVKNIRINQEKKENILSFEEYFDGFLQDSYR